MQITLAHHEGGYTHELPAVGPSERRNAAVFHEHDDVHDGIFADASYVQISNIVQDILGYFFSVDINVLNGAQDCANLHVRGNVTLTQESGADAGPSNNQAWPLIGYCDWRSPTYQTLSSWYAPTYGPGLLDLAELDLKSINVPVTFNSLRFADHHLDVFIQNPSLRLFTTREVDARGILNDSPRLTAPIIRGLLDASAADAGQIRFPATQNASSDVHTLDDYVEGIPSASWTPTDGSSAGVSLTVTSAQHLKLGTLAVVTFSITYPTKSNASGASVAGLPFTAAAGTSTLGGFVTYTDSGLAFSFLVLASTSTFDFRVNTGANVTNVQLSGRDCSRRTHRLDERMTAGNRAAERVATTPPAGVGDN